MLIDKKTKKIMVSGFHQHSEKKQGTKCDDKNKKLKEESKDLKKSEEIKTIKKINDFES